MKATFIPLLLLLAGSACSDDSRTPFPDSGVPDAGDDGGPMDGGPGDSSPADAAPTCETDEVLIDGACVTRPMVVSVTPADGAVEVSPSADIVLAFSEAMDTTAVEGAVAVTRTVDDGAVSGTIAWDGSDTTLTFTPDEALTLGHEYRIEVGTDALAATGAGLAETFAATSTVVGVTGEWEGTAMQGTATYLYRWSLFQQGECVSGVVSLALSDGTNYGSYEVLGTVSGDQVLIDGTGFVGDGATKGWCLASLATTLAIPEGDAPTLDGTFGPLPGVTGGCASGIEGSVAISRITPTPSVTAPIPDVSGEWEGTASQASTDYYYRWALHQADGDVVGTVSIGTLPGGAGLATYAITGTVDDAGALTWAGTEFLGDTVAAGWCIAQGELSLSADGTALVGTFFGGLTIPDACDASIAGTVALDRYETCGAAP